VVGSSKRFFSGPTAYTICLANALSKRNQVSVVLLRNLLPRFLYPGRAHVGKDQYTIDFAPGIDVYEGMDYNSPLSWLGAYRFLMKNKPDAVIMLWWSSAVAHMQLLLKLVSRFRIRARVIVNVHEVVDPLEARIMPIKLYSRLAGWLLLRGIDACTTQSEFDRAQVSRAYGVKEEKISVIMHGLYEDYNQPMDRSLARKGLGIDEEFVILYFGLIRHYKGVPYLLETFNSLPESVAERSRLLIVGEVWEEGDKIRQLIDNSPHKSQISTEFQYVPDAMIPRYFSAADVVVLPYLRASSSGVAHIAMLYGRPIIISDIDPLRESLSDYEGALFAAPEDTAAIRECLLNVHESLQSRGTVHYAPPERSWDGIAARYEAILDGLLSARPAVQTVTALPRKTMKVSAVVCTHNLDNYQNLVEAVTSLLEQTHRELEVIIVVDGNERLYRRVMEDYGGQERIHVVLLEENVGLSGARNAGIKVAQGDIVAFIDDDAVAEQGWIENLVDIYSKYDAIAVGGKVLPIWLRQKPDYLPEELYWLVAVTHDGFAEEEVTEVRNTFGPNMSFKREVFEEVGGFSEDFGFSQGTPSLAQAEEAEFALRVKQKLGKGMIYKPEAIVYHKIPPSKLGMRTLLRRAYYQGYSKAMLERQKLHADPIATERSYLKALLLRYIPRRMMRIYRPSEMKKLSVLVASIFSVGLGFVCGYTKECIVGWKKR